MSYGSRESTAALPSKIRYAFARRTPNFNWCPDTVSSASTASASGCPGRNSKLKVSLAINVDQSAITFVSFLASLICSENAIIEIEVGCFAQILDVAHHFARQAF